MMVNQKSFLVYSSECLKSRKVLRNVLSDILKGNRLYVNLALSAFDAGIVRKIDSANVIDDVFRTKCVRYLVRNHGIIERAAEAAVDFWISNYAKNTLGKKIKDKTLNAGRKKKSVDSRKPSVESPTKTRERKKVPSNNRYVLNVKGLEFPFRFCCPGEFNMGSPTSEQGRYVDERQHKVKISNGFWLLETTVTQIMWETVMGSNMLDQISKNHRDTPNGIGKDYPMRYVNLYECEDFCARLSKLTGVKIALPTEAQWEYACRSGSVGPFGGTGLIEDMGWCRLNATNLIHEVALKKPNQWGLYDMHGNVWEWCSDWYSRDYVNYTQLYVDPEGPVTGSYRVVRGGSWFSALRFCRSAVRGYSSPSERDSYTGFRPVMILS